MCSMIVLLFLVLGGWFGFSSVRTDPVVPPQVETVSPATALYMMPTSTPTESDPATALFMMPTFTPTESDPATALFMMPTFTPTESDPATALFMMPTSTPTESDPATALFMTPTFTPTEAASTAQPMITATPAASDVPPVEATAVVSSDALPIQATECATVSEAEDRANLLALVGNAFQPSVWTLQVRPGEARTDATWLADNYGAVAYMEYLHYDCGIPAGALDEYYSDDGFDTLLANYQSHRKTAECSRDDLRLYEFDVTFNSGAYLMRYWVRQVSPTRVMGMVLVFPASLPSKMDGFAHRLFPQLPACEAAAQ